MSGLDSIEDAGQAPPGGLRQGLACLGQGIPVVIPAKETGPQIALQRGDMTADARLAQAQLTGGPGEALMARRRFEHAERSHQGLKPSEAGLHTLSVWKPDSFVKFNSGNSAGIMHKMH